LYKSYIILDTLIFGAVLSNRELVPNRAEFLENALLVQSFLISENVERGCFLASNVKKSQIFSRVNYSFKA